MKIPYVDLGRAFKKHKIQHLIRIDNILSSGQLYGGTYVKEFEEKIAERCDRKYAVAVGSCTDALYFALMAHKLSYRLVDEVVVPAYTFPASASCIVRAGAIPVFADASSNGMVSVEEVEKVITDNTKAIIVVNLFGEGVKGEFQELADKHDLILIEDASQSFGAMHDSGIPVGKLGNASCLSFDPIKGLGSIGGGGMYVTDDQDCANSVYEMRDLGKNFGHKSRMSTLEAGILLQKLEYFDDDNKRRLEIAMKYGEGMEIGYASDTSVWSKCVIYPENKENLRNFFFEYAIETKNIYSKPLCNEDVFARFKRDECVKAETLCRKNVALPIFPEMTDEEVDYVIEVFQKYAALV